MDIETTGSRIVYENRWMRLREDSIRRRDGSPGLYGVVEKLDYSLVVPVDDRGFYLIEQYRYPVGARYWEFPQGTWEDNPGAGPDEVAREEMQAEIGLTARHMTYLGHIFGAYGITAQRCHVFLATDLTAGDVRREPEEQDLRVHHAGFDEFPGLVASGQIRDASTLAAYTLLLLRQGVRLRPPFLPLAVGEGPFPSGGRRE